MKMKHAYWALLTTCVLALVGARPMMRGYPTGGVIEVDRQAGAVSVDLGRPDGAIKGMNFSIVDDKGGQVAVITVDEVHDDRFWSRGGQADRFARVRPGMEVRWVLTPEVMAAVKAVKKNAAPAYKEFVDRFPGSRFLPEMIRVMPEEMLRELSPEYHHAWKAYTRRSFEEFIGLHPGSGFALAAQAELKSIEEFEAEGERIRKEREARALAAEAERARQQSVEEKIRERQDMAQRKEMLGRLINNSAAPVRFVFDPPSQQAPVTVEANSNTDLRHQSGTYTYKVYRVEGPSEGPAFEEPGIDDEERKGPAPLGEGEAYIEFDFWEVEYP